MLITDLCIQTLHVSSSIISGKTLPVGSVATGAKLRRSRFIDCIVHVI